MKRQCIFLLLFFSITMAPLQAQDRVTGRAFATRSEVIAQNGMACTSHPLATQVALDILKAGGSAIDAAIAANATLGLMEPTGCGVGGDLFAIVWDAGSGQLYGLNGSGRSPKSLTLDYFKKEGMDKIPALGPLPVSVPGAVDGWFELHGKFGKLPMKEVLQPAIAYAEQGFPVTELIAYYLGRSVPYYIRQGFPNVAETYTIDGANPPQKGDIFKNPALANTYKALAAGGRDAFYKGEIARVIADFIQEQGGFLSYDDLAAHRSEWVEPVSVNYRGYDVWELPPNGQGIAALQLLNLLEGYDLKSMGFGSPEYIHHFVEAKKVAFEDRARYYADMDFYDVPLDTLLSKEYAAARRALINPNYAGRYSAGEISAGETIYLTVADQFGNMISLIQSNYRGMGSGMVPPGLGFMLQDRGELFSLQEGQANTYEPGKRPFHTIIPAFVTKDGKPFLSFGVMGGDFQPQGHAQIIINMIDFGMSLQEAGDAPRIDHSGGSSPTGQTDESRGEVHLESGLPYETIRQLMRMGHQVGFANGIYGGYQAILYDAEKKVYYGASESRKDGHAAGY
ncbi:gamma-glutamyltransferase [Phaeodactylibacter luteus]|uniref:Glutathione hydrolase proenzyme n=1 Tax=Phaeodactylibacter luteus TaxID=1564516 RepID=A0A5C6RME5_9BACT|nr:gamma-glutamyltransferase [Phaeodactylibacter luteus]TXB63581.1 gamma-glutamyltransferase [Phaeodactylibacter luteus]